MRRSRFGIALALALGILCAPAAIEAQPVRRVPRIGFLGPGSAAGSAVTKAAFRQALRELGYIEGLNINIEWRWAEGRADRLSVLAQELVGLEVDVLVSPNGAAVRSLKVATATLPIVMAGAEGIVERGLILSLARPGGNITGLIPMVQELEAKRMELLKETVPGISRVAVFLDLSTDPLRTVGPPFERWGLTFPPIPVRGPDDLDGGFATAVKERARAISMVNTPLFYTNRTGIADRAIKHRLAWIAPDRDYAEAGSLMSYGADGNDLVRRSVIYVDKILKGAKPGDLPVEQPTRFELVVNLRTARALGLAVPEVVLFRADHVIR